MIAGAEISTGDDGDDVIYREKKKSFRNWIDTRPYQLILLLLPPPPHTHFEIVKFQFSIDGKQKIN